MKEISVIICCYNSSSRLPETLTYLLHQEDLEDVAWEIIVVDNASTDSTPAVATGLLEKFNKVGRRFSFKIVSEKSPGLSNARKAGVLNSSYPILVFCDDDNWLDKKYLKGCIDLFDQNPTLAILGAGQALPVSDIAIPEWFAAYGSILACQQIDEAKTGYTVQDNIYAYGAGMAVRRNVYLGYLELCSREVIRLKLDRQKNVLLSGGDTDLNLFAFKKNMGVGLYPQLKLKHYMPPSRISKKYLIQLRKYTTASSLILEKINFGRITGGHWNTLGLIKHLGIQLLKGPFYFRMALAGLEGSKMAHKLLSELEEERI